MQQQRLGSSGAVLDDVENDDGHPECVILGYQSLSSSYEIAISTYTNSRTANIRFTKKPHSVGNKRTLDGPGACDPAAMHAGKQKQHSPDGCDGATGAFSAAYSKKHSYLGG